MYSSISIFFWSSLPIMYYNNSCPEKDHSNVQRFASDGLADLILATGLAEFEENLAVKSSPKKIAFNNSLWSKFNLLYFIFDSLRMKETCKYTIQDTSLGHKTLNQSPQQIFVRF